MLNFYKSQLAQALNLTRQRFWKMIIPFYGKFPKEFKTQKVISLPDAKKLLMLLGYETEIIETTLKNIK